MTPLRPRQAAGIGRRAAGAALFALCAAAASPALAWSPFVMENGNVKKGNKLVAQGKEADAVKQYDAALAKVEEPAGVHFDKGVALLKLAQKDTDKESVAYKTNLYDAARAFTSAIETAPEGASQLKGDSFYNLGNAYAAQGRWEEAAGAYRQALKTRPGDKDAAFNLALALKKAEEEKKRQEEEKKKQEEQEKQQQEQEQQQNKDQQDEQQQDEQQQEQQQEQEQEKQQGEKQQPEQQQGGKQPQPEQGQQEEQQEEKQPQAGEQQEQQVPLTEQQAEAILDALQRNEKNYMLENLKQYGKGKSRVLKDW